MTEDEFCKTKWQPISHMSFREQHSTTYKCMDILELYCCRTVNFKDGEPTGRGGTVHYMLNGKVYKTKQKLLEALNNGRRKDLRQLQ